MLTQAYRRCIESIKRDIDEHKRRKKAAAADAKSWDGDQKSTKRQKNKLMSTALLIIFIPFILKNICERFSGL